MKAKATIFVTVPIKISADRADQLDEVAKDAAEQLHVGFWGLGVDGAYEARSLDTGRTIRWKK